MRRTDAGQAIGIVELGFEMCQRAGLEKPKNMRGAVALGNVQAVEFAEWMVWVGMRWSTWGNVLVGVAWAFMEMHEMVAGLEVERAVLSEEGMRVLKGIAERERTGLEACRKEIGGDEERNKEFRRGVGIGRRAVEACFTS